ncbi:MAG: protein kinase [Gemmatimonadaceae bacterium]|nr:protein kinase [Gemmatimonadaceae bacterium]
MGDPTNAGEAPLVLEEVLAGRYRVVREIGRGGMARVYLADDLRYHRQVAIKVLTAMASGPHLTERFQREIATVAKLTHPHIVPLLDSGEENGLRWFVMPHIEGDSLRQRIDHDKQLALPDAVQIALEVAKALRYAHEHGVIHRDIKPENVLLSNGTAVVADFGLAKLQEAGTVTLTHRGVAVGSALYMSPEQSTGSDDIDARSDLYSLGTILFEMLTGEAPYVGQTAQAVIAKRFTDPVPRASHRRATITPALDEVLLKVLAKAPRDRYASARAFEEALTRALRTPAPPRYISSAAHPAFRVRRGIALAVAAAVVLTTGTAFAWRRWGTPRAEHASAAIGSVAVRPFTDLSTTKDQGYFSTGMTDELLAALASIPGLRVAARSSSYALAGEREDPRRFGEKLQVDAVLEGTVRREGDRVKVTAELVNVRDGFSLWSRSYERKVDDMFTLQEEIARAIVGAVGAELDGRRTAIANRTTTDVTAYQLYLRGRLALEPRTPTSLRDARVFFERAVERDSTYARAWAGLADVACIQALNIFEAPAEAFARAKDAAGRAYALDSTLAEPQTSLANIAFFFDRDAATAERMHRRAIARDSTSALAYYWYGIFLATVGRSRDALRAAEHAQRLDPYSPPTAMSVGIVRSLSGEYPEAIAPLRAVVALQPDYAFASAWLAVALAETGAMSDAVEAARRATARASDAMLLRGYLAYVLARTGDQAGARTLLAELERASSARPVPSIFIARSWDALGDGAQAIRWLERADAARDAQFVQLRAFPHFRTIANDPRFLALQARAVRP